MCALLTPEILQAGVVKGLIYGVCGHSVFALSVCETFSLLGRIPYYGEQTTSEAIFFFFFFFLLRVQLQHYEDSDSDRLHKKALSILESTNEGR